MPIPAIIDGILVHRDFLHNRPKFSFHRYPFPHTALRPGSYSSCIPPIRPLLKTGIRILYIYTPSLPETDKHIDPDFPSFFFSYMSGNVRQSRATAYMVFYRDDFKPLCPKQARVLWDFCDRLVFKIYRAVEHRYLWVTSEDGDTDFGWRFEEVVRCGARIWKEQCTVDGFSAFFERYRRDRLLEGREAWRWVESPYDT